MLLQAGGCAAVNRVGAVWTCGQAAQPRRQERARSFDAIRPRPPAGFHVGGQRCRQRVRGPGRSVDAGPRDRVANGSEMATVQADDQRGSPPLIVRAVTNRRRDQPSGEPLHRQWARRGAAAPPRPWLGLVCG
ncbi:hypothetical protein [Mycobacterium syngnathidarum]|uniref:hypothetical protein n=1 Tax=Mycobacterium syngnathidarum TaxID=1908205 RepID=UPI00095C0F25|nr:hypothetical protein [Mycobacterium syngnathidarum]OLT97886.1 hypothetical protein BKG60_03875 [Mycobacterium syngnathidarum]